jgi:flagellar FliJ protein
MKPFAFHTVLAYRKRLEDIAQQRLAEAKKVRDAVQQKLREEKTNLSHLIQTTESLQTEGVNITELVRYEEQIIRVKSNVMAIEKNFMDKAEIVRQERHNLVRRAKDRQIMERLKDHQDMAWKAYLDKKEIAMLDEIAIIRHGSEKE